MNIVNQFTVYNDIENLCKILNVEMADTNNTERPDKISNLTRKTNM